MKKKILVGYIMDGTSGGIDRYLLRFIEQVWEEDIQIDFLSDRSAYELKKRLEKYKSRVFQVSSLWHPVTQYRQMQKIIQENGYDVVYLNISTAMDFIDATGLTIGKSTNGDYITSINGLGSIDVEYTSNSYKGYSWMIDMKAGNSVTTQGTKPSWAAAAPEANAWFESPLAATNVAMSGSQYFPYYYSNQSAGGFTTSVEGIYVKYVLTETTW